MWISPCIIPETGRQFYASQRVQTIILGRKVRRSKLAKLWAKLLVWASCNARFFDALIKTNLHSVFT